MTAWPWPADRIGLVAVTQSFYEVTLVHTPGVIKINPLKLGQQKLEHPFMKPPPCFSTVSIFHDHYDYFVTPSSPTDAFLPLWPFLRSLKSPSWKQQSNNNQSACCCWFFFTGIVLFSIHRTSTFLFKCSEFNSWITFSAFYRATQALPATMAHKFDLKLSSVKWRQTSVWPLMRGFLLGESI